MDHCSIYRRVNCKKRARAWNTEGGCLKSLVTAVIEPVEMTIYTISGGFENLNHRELFFLDSPLNRPQPEYFSGEDGDRIGKYGRPDPKDKKKRTKSQAFAACKPGRKTAKKEKRCLWGCAQNYKKIFNKPFFAIYSNFLKLPVYYKHDYSTQNAGIAESGRKKRTFMRWLGH